MITVGAYVVVVIIALLIRQCLKVGIANTSRGKSQLSRESGTLILEEILDFFGSTIFPTSVYQPRYIMRTFLFHDSWIKNSRMIKTMRNPVSKISKFWKLWFYGEYHSINFLLFCLSAKILWGDFSFMTAESKIQEWNTMSTIHLSYFLFISDQNAVDLI